jgi:hypothetical protein
MENPTERTTQELMEQLADDCERCHTLLIQCIDAGEIDSDGGVRADYEFFARQLIRAVFAFLEAVTFSAKASCAGICMNRGIEISPEERYFATDTEYDLNDKGEVVETVAKIPLARNIRFAINMKRRAYRESEPFDASVEWWSSLKTAIRIRDRLTHPKMPGDLDISGEDIVTVLRARDGFTAEFLRDTGSGSGRPSGYPTRPPTEPDVPN